MATPRITAASDSDDASPAPGKNESLHLSLMDQARSSRSTPHDAGTRIVAAVDGSTEHQTALRGKDGVTRKGFPYTKCQSHDCEEKGCSAIES